MPGKVRAGNQSRRLRGHNHRSVGGTAGLRLLLIATPPAELDADGLGVERA